MIGTDALGSRWPKIIRARPKPRARAASVYSIFLRLRKLALMICATANQGGDANDDDDRILAAPEHGGDGDGEDEVGIERKMSTMRIISESVRPPKKPDSAPNVTPISSARSVERTPIFSETRAPYTTRVKTS